VRPRAPRRGPPTRHYGPADGSIVNVSTSDFRIPGYEIIGQIGRGGMAVVYKARHLLLNREVAIKLLSNGDDVAPQTQHRLRAEAQVLAGLKVPGVVQVHDVGVHDGKLYLVLELVEGGSLDRHTKASACDPRTAATLVAKLARIVQACHDRGVLHRDLKPANVLLTLDGEPKIADFGLAKCVGSSRLTASGAMLGTPAYMAPEQAGESAGGVGPAADVYGLGAILYELLTSRPPFDGATPLDVVRRVSSEEPVRPSAIRPGLPPDLETICLKCLQKDPARRYASALDLALDLERFLRNESILGKLPPWPVRAVRRAKRYPVLATAVVCVVVQSLLFWLWTNLEDDARFAIGSLLVGGLTLTATAAGVVWFVIRPARLRDRLLRLVVAIVMAVVADRIHFAVRHYFFNLAVEQKGLMGLTHLAFLVLVSGPAQGLGTGIVWLAVSAGGTQDNRRGMAADRGGDDHRFLGKSCRGWLRPRIDSTRCGGYRGRDLCGFRDASHGNDRGRRHWRMVVQAAATTDRAVSADWGRPHG
jgi:serine/threonine protein kinase